eukprot:3170040-Pyramimonas_sp.AAC.1
MGTGRYSSSSLGLDSGAPLRPPFDKPAVPGATSHEKKAARKRSNSDHPREVGSSVERERGG